MYECSVALRSVVASRESPLAQGGGGGGGGVY